MPRSLPIPQPHLFPVLFPVLLPRNLFLFIHDVSIASRLSNVTCHVYAEMMKEQMPEKEYIGQEPLEAEILSIGEEIRRLTDEAFYARGRGEIESAGALEKQKDELLAKQRALLQKRAAAKAYTLKDQA